MRRGIPHLVGTAAAVALVLGLAGGALAVPPPSAVDQKHECADVHCNTGGTVGVYPVTAEFLGGSNPQDVSLGQTFTAGVTGDLTGVELYLFGFDTAIPASFTVQIQSTTSGAPSGTVLGSVSVPTSGLLTTPSWVTVTLGTPIAITKDTVYAITLAPLASVASNQAWLSWELDSSDTAAYTDYAGGSAFAYAAGGGGWSNGGSAFADGGSVNTDFAFRTLVAAAVATPVASVPTQPPTSTVSATPVSSAGGGLTATLVLLVSVGLAAFIALARPARRRR